MGATAMSGKETNVQGSEVQRACPESRHSSGSRRIAGLVEGFRGSTADIVEGILAGVGDLGLSINEILEAANGAAPSTGSGPRLTREDATRAIRELKRRKIVKDVPPAPMERFWRYVHCAPLFGSGVAAVTAASTNGDRS
jgi:hypothetical protein